MHEISRSALFVFCTEFGQCASESRETASKIASAGAAANCCKLDSALRHHLARTSTARPLPQLKVQRSSNDAGCTAAFDPKQTYYVAKRARTNYALLPRVARQARQ